MNDVEHVSFDDLCDLLTRIFTAHGCSGKVARLVADNIATAERDGAASHGIFRVDGNLATLASGWIDGHAKPELTDVAPGVLRADAKNGYSLAALDLARPVLIDKARANGTAVLAIHNSQHFGALWPDVEPFARAGFVAISMVNSMACVVPFSGSKPVYGTNPFAFATPRAKGDPVVFDQASSAMANGDVQIAVREGRQLPEDAGVDKNGHPTTDPNAVLDGGALLTFGGYKGSSIAMMIEIMAAALTGGKFSFEVDWSQHPGAVIPHTGQFILLIDPAKGAVRPFAERVEVLIAQLRDAGVERLPADRRYANRRRSERDGIAVPASELQRLRGLAGL